MIIKSFELSKLDHQKSNIILLYGDNEGFKKQVIKEHYIEKNKNKKINKYDETDILNNLEDFITNLLNKSFFDEEKIIIISRATDKILKLVEEFLSKHIKDVILIITSGSLEKKSKLRNFFEKEKKIICIPFYPDQESTLASIANIYFKKLNISISRESINLIIEKCNGDRQNLNNELQKISNYLEGKSKISIEQINKLTNLVENYSISELVDNCLSKNTKKTVKILNENNFSSEEFVQITRTLLLKSKRVLKLKNDCDNGKNVDEAISEYKPPIFWKDKTIVKNQLLAWKKNDAEKLITEINDIELLIKKNSTNSINIISDFILNTTNKTNN